MESRTARVLRTAHGRSARRPKRPRVDREAALQLVERHQLAGDRAGRHGGRAREPDRARARAAREVAVDRAHGDLLGIARRAGPAVGAGAARRLQQLGADLLEGVEVAAARCSSRARPSCRTAGTASTPRRHAQAALGRPAPAPRGSGRSPRACRRCTSRRRRCRRAARSPQLAERHAVAGVARARDHRRQCAAVDADRRRRSARRGRCASTARCSNVDAAALAQEAHASPRRARRCR